MCNVLKTLHLTCFTSKLFITLAFLLGDLGRILIFYQKHSVLFSFRFLQMAVPLKELSKFASKNSAEETSNFFQLLAILLKYYDAF